MIDTLDASALVQDLFHVRYVHQLIDEHERFAANHSHVLWALLNLAVWHRLFAGESTRRPSAVLSC
jgi:asparagine synthase (glutamine-hydrolysing)